MREERQSDRLGGCLAECGKLECFPSYGLMPLQILPYRSFSRSVFFFFSIRNIRKVCIFFQSSSSFCLKGSAFFLFAKAKTWKHCSFRVYNKSSQTQQISYQSILLFSSSFSSWEDLHVVHWCFTSQVATCDSDRYGKWGEPVITESYLCTIENRQYHAIGCTHALSQCHDCVTGCAGTGNVSKRKEQQALLTGTVQDLSGRVLFWSLICALYSFQCSHPCFILHWYCSLNLAKDVHFSGPVTFCLFLCVCETGLDCAFRDRLCHSV